MTRADYSHLQAPPSSQQIRDSLELASLASSAISSPRTSLSSSSESGISSSRKLSLESEDPLSSSHRPINAPEAPRHARTYSVSSAFDFASNLFPLTASAGGYAPLGAPSTLSLDRLEGSLEKHKSLTYLDGLSLVVGLIIGSGIFSSPSQVNVNAGSPGASLIVWVIAGLLAWTGAASYAELGGAIPLNGGAQAYLSKIFGELFGFLFTWCAVCVLKPGSAAIIAIIFGEYIVRACIGADSENANEWINKGVALGGLVLATFFNCVSTKLAARVGDLFMFFKFVALVGIAIIGIIVAATGYSYKGEASHDWKTTGWFEGTNTDVSQWAVALYAGLWAFDGWDNVNYVTGEFKTPHRDLPRVIHTSMPLVIAGYLLANISYFLVLPISVTSTTNTVAVQFGSQVFGPLGALIFALFVSLSCFGALNATTFTSGRLVYVAGKEGYLPMTFGRLGLTSSTPSIHINPHRTQTSLLSPFCRLARLIGDNADGTLFYTPIPAMILNASLTSIYILLGSFTTLLTFYGVAGYTFYFLTVLGLIVLRVKEPHLERPYKTWITTPVIFCCVSLFLLSRAVFAEPLQTVIVVGFIAVGAGVYYWKVRRRHTSGGVNGGMGAMKERSGSAWKFWRRWGS
ncbi:MAG: hypothetical protein M1834_000456 [Cirrosporium novae-zelandiae]|nr:MAG: hypothetical protein M1834_000456 [Cirrosporium novae-zelandiae]